jgi:hypothetical protein
MLDIERILKEERLIRAMTGLNSKAFNALLPSFTEASEKSLIKPEIKKTGNGRREKSNIERNERQIVLYIVVLQMLSDFRPDECVI